MAVSLLTVQWFYFCLFEIEYLEDYSMKNCNGINYRLCVI